MRVKFAVALLRLVQFLKMYTLQRSAAPRLRCCGIFDDSFIANCPHSVPVKEFFLNRFIFGEGMEKSVLARFYGSRCMKINVL